MKSWIPILLLLFGWQCGQSPRSYEIKPIDEAGLEQLLNQRNGKILVLNVWATWCIPCKEEFATLIMLADKYQNQNVEVAGISADYADEIDSKIRPFLNLFNINFNIYVQKFKNESDLINRLHPEWNGALPATFIFDTNGMLYKFIEGKRSLEFFVQEIEKLLKNTEKG